MTNADRIRGMNDEELAQMLCLGTNGFYCDSCKERVLKNKRCDTMCLEHCRKWLRQEAKEDEP